MKAAVAIVLMVALAGCEGVGPVTVGEAPEGPASGDRKSVV